MCDWQLCFSMTCLRCTVNVTHSRGPSTDPSGPPNVSLVDDALIIDSALSCAWNARFLRYVCSHFIVSPINPYVFSSRASRISWSTVSNATDRSRRHRAVTRPESVAVAMSLKTFKSTVFVLWNCLSTDYVMGMALVAFKFATILAWTIFSRIFYHYGRFDTDLNSSYPEYQVWPFSAMEL